MTSVPDLTRLIARIADWQEGHGKPGGPMPRAVLRRRTSCLLDEVSNMLGDVRRELMGRR